MLHKTVDPPGGWGGEVTLVIPQLRVHNPLTVDPELIGISIDYGFMRAADVVLGASDDESRLRAEITRTRMRYRDAKGTPVPGPFGPAKPVDPVDEPPLDPDHLQHRLATLVARRRDSGLPLAPPVGRAGRRQPGRTMHLRVWRRPAMSSRRRRRHTG